MRHAPHLVDAQVGNVPRRMTARGALAETEAARVRALAEAAVAEAGEPVAVRVVPADLVRPLDN
ncbi:MAG TPA: hypothetical protein VG452_03765 [Egibacteraceae bacterium]|nr:hypothetical protein [Egibacteraceae bacterium]